MPNEPFFSVGIPNFNYADYIGETIESVLAQGRGDVEIHVSDNASTDRSREVVTSFAARGVKLSVNRTNVGFSGNLDRAIGPTHGRFALMLSSDDLMRSGALDTYARLIDILGAESARTVFASAYEIVDSKGNVRGADAAEKYLWSESDVDRSLSDAVGKRVMRVAAHEMLRRALTRMRNPLPFLSALYPRALYDSIEGYGAGRQYNPDKWFHWRLLGAADTAIFVDAPLFAWRIHGKNQNAQMQKQGALKHLVDEYLSTFELSEALLSRAGINREALIDAFVERDIVDRGFKLLAAGRRTEAQRYARFGAATYPMQALRSTRWWALRGALSAGPVGVAAARAALRLVGKAAGADELYRT